MGKRERRSLYNRLVRLIEHLLKWPTPARAAGLELPADDLYTAPRHSQVASESPSLRPNPDEIIAETYDEAAGAAALSHLRDPELNSRRPARSRRDQLLDEGYLPPD